MRDNFGNTTLACLAGIFFLLLSGTVLAWSGDAYLNTTVSAVTGDQLYPVSTSDGAGGTVVAWEDRRSGGRAIYAQRLSADGQALWTANGVQVSAGTALEEQQAIVADGSGGVYIAWISSADGRIHLQHLDGNGAAVSGWGATGIVVSSGNTINSDTQPTLIADGSGGVFVAWQYYSATTSSDIYATRIDSDGSVHIDWTVGGDVVCDDANGQYGQALLGDGSGSVIVVWYAFVGGYDKVYAQKLSGGVRQWDAGGGNFNGIALATSTNYQTRLRIVEDGAGGAIVLWEDYRSDSSGDIYGQRIDGNGVLQWNTAGVALVTVAGSSQDSIQAISDQNGGAYLVWRDSRDAGPSFPADSDIYLHRIDSTGAGVSGWTANGTLLSTIGSGYNSNPALLNDSASGVVVVWRDSNYPIYEMRAQRVSSTAVKQWGSTGVAVTSKGGYVAIPAVTPATDGGALIAWAHTVIQGDFEIFAQRVYSDGSLSSVATPTTVSPTGGEESSQTLTLTAAAFNDSATASTQAGAQWRVLDYAVPAADRPQVRAVLTNMQDGDVSYTLPFNFPFYGRTITAISVNRSGMIELLEAGESCLQCTIHGVHQNVDYSAMDVIFASNDSIVAEDGYVNVYHGGDHVMVEWYGQTMADGGSAAAALATFMPSGIALPSTGITNPLHFQVLLYSNGAIVWNFQQMDFVAYDYDMYSGVHAAGGSDVDVGQLINVQSSYVFNPSSNTVSTVAYTWDNPADYIVYDSGETAVDLSSHDVPSTAGMLDEHTYYWAVRYVNNLGDWTEWSVADSFTTPAATTTSSSGGGLFHPLLVMLLGLLWWMPINSEGRRRWSK